jgi:hypothetical protein
MQLKSWDSEKVIFPYVKKNFTFCKLGASNPVSKPSERSTHLIGIPACTSSFINEKTVTLFNKRLSFERSQHGMQESFAAHLLRLF